MIQVNELRIGNLVERVLHNGRHICYEKVERLEGKYYGELPSSDVKPISLTEEWLLKAGFEKHTSNPFWFKNGIVCISVLWKVELITWDNQRIALENEVNYVHQLQNLVFALTGKELEFKL